MKKVMLSLIAMIVMTMTYAQDAPGLYTKTGDTLVKIEPISIAMQIGGPRLGGDLVGVAVSTVKKYKGVTSANKVGTHPEFIFKFVSEDNPAVKKAKQFVDKYTPSDFALIRLEQGKKFRKVDTGASLMTPLSAYGHSIKDANNTGLTPVIKELGGGVYQLTFTTPVPAGEYGFIFVGSNSVLKDQYQHLFDFCVAE